MFYTAEALLNERSLRFKKHGGVHAAFGEHFAKPGLLDAKYHRWLLAAFEKRITKPVSFSMRLDNIWPANRSGQVTSVRVYRNTHGQIVLSPMVSVPADEAWLFQNKQASHMVQRGLEDAKRGRLVKAKEDYSKYAAGKD
jgi:hypothetical protein